MLQRYTAKLKEKESLAPSVYRFIFVLQNGDALNFKAGQYIILDIPDGGKMVKRLYSIASLSTSGRELELIIKIIPNGIGSTYLESLKVNEPIAFQAPAGMFTLRKPFAKQIVFLATGTGIAPELFMIKHLLGQEVDSELFLFWGLRFLKDIYLENELTEFRSKHKNFHFKYCLSRESGLKPPYFSSGRVDKCLSTFLSKGIIDKRSQFYICGSRTVVKSLKATLKALHIFPSNIFFEKF